MPTSTTSWTSRRSCADVTVTGDLLAVTLGPGIDAAFTGAVIAGVDDANLAHHRPHDPRRLAEARDRVAALTRTESDAWHLMRQVHGAGVAVVDGSVPRGAELRDVDVLVTALPDRPLVVLAADCVPVLAAGRRSIAVAHVGWRGLAADAPGALVTALVELGESPAQVRVALGPAIGPCCYEVGPEVRAAVGAIDPDAVAMTRAGRPSVDLRAALRTRLADLGVLDVADAGLGEGPVRAPLCTACDPGWFSHRRDPAAGRQAGIIVRRAVVPGGDG